MSLASVRVDPRLRLLYLLGVAVGVFLLPRSWALAGAVAVQAVLWFVVGLPPRQLLRQFKKLWLFSLFIAASYAFFSDDAESARWVKLSFGALGALTINLGGLAEGAAMLARVITVILASHVARAGDPRAIVAALTKLRAPRII